MSKLLTIAVVAISMAAFGTAYADGYGGCAIGKSYLETSVDEDKYSDVQKKLAKLSLPLTEDASTSGEATSKSAPAEVEKAAPSRVKTVK